MKQNHVPIRLFAEIKPLSWWRSAFSFLHLGSSKLLNTKSINITGKNMNLKIHASETKNRFLTFKHIFRYFSIKFQHFSNQIIDIFQLSSTFSDQIPTYSTQISTFSIIFFERLRILSCYVTAKIVSKLPEKTDRDKNKHRKRQANRGS